MLLNVMCWKTWCYSWRHLILSTFVCCFTPRLLAFMSSGNIHWSFSWNAYLFDWKHFFFPVSATHFEYVIKAFTIAKFRILKRTFLHHKHVLQEKAEYYITCSLQSTAPMYWVYIWFIFGSIGSLVFQCRLSIVISGY